MRFLLDTNCWMQIIREREHVQQVRDLIKAVGDSNLAITGLSLHSIVMVMHRHKMLDKLPAFLEFSGIDVSVEVVRVPTAGLTRLVEVSRRYRLDVDDAYQHIAAELHGLKLVSLDVDFDRIPNARLARSQAMEVFRKEQGK
jgi:predicted nucleic acid-binding protein